MEIKKKSEYIISLTEDEMRILKTCLLNSDVLALENKAFRDNLKEMISNIL
jgi:hypothetical protein